MSELTRDRLKELMHYDQETGVFTRLVTTNNRGAKAGDTAGSKSKNGYLFVSIGYKKYLLHRLAWLYVHGCWPEKDIDHINGIRTDNRIANLRDVSRSENLQNTRGPRANSSSGLLGVSFDKGRNKWTSQIMLDGKHIHLGRFDDKEKAHQEYLKAKRIHHSTCTI